MSHGTRACYQSGCRETACRAANARYEAQYRLDKAKSRVRLNDRISPIQARRRIKQLKAEQMTDRDLMARIGLKGHSLTVHDAITVRKDIAIWKLHRTLMAEGPSA